MRSAKKISVLLLLGVAFAGTAAAQQAATAQPAGKTDEQNGQIALKKPVPATPKDQLAEAQRLTDAMGTTSQRVCRTMWKAREARDVVKAICADDKCSQADVAVRSAKDRLRTLKAAADSNDSGGAKHEFVMIRTLAERADQLVSEVNQCIGEEAGFVGDTKVNATVDSTMPDPIEVTQFPTTPPPVFTQPPACTSCVD